MLGKKRVSTGPVFIFLLHLWNSSRGYWLVNKYKRNENVVERKIHGAFYLINIKDNYLDDKCRLYEMNEMGDVIWNILDISSREESQIDFIVNRIKELIVDEVPYDIIKEDVESFIDSINKEGFLEVV